MGGERLYAFSRRPDPRRRSSRRSLRATSDVPGRHCRLRRRVGAMRPFAESELADCGAGGARGLRRLDGPAEPRDHFGIVPGRHPRPCNWHLGRGERAHDGDGAGARRCADRHARLARGILDQPSDRRRSRVLGLALRAGKPVRQHAGSTRLARRSACRSGGRAIHPRSHRTRRRRRRLGGIGSLPGGRRRRRRFRRRGAPRCVASDAARFFFRHPRLPVPISRRFSSMALCLE